MNALYMAAHQAGSSDIFAMMTNLVTKLGHVAGAALVLIAGVIIGGHASHHRAGAVIGAVLLFLIPAWFILDAPGAMSTLKATVNGL